MAETIAHIAHDAGLPVHEAERLLIRVTGRGREALIADPNLDEWQTRRFEEFAARRRSGEPLQYLEGLVQFGAIELVVDRRALIPRPESERMWELAVEAVGSPGVIVDLCTGCGNLALSLKQAFPGARVLATDLSSAALSLASANGNRLGLDVDWLEGDLFEPLPSLVEGKVDLLVANPPYVAESQYELLPKDVREWEPPEALVAGPRGDEVLEAIAESVASWLTPGGWLRSGGSLFCEIGETQSVRTLDLFAQLKPKIANDLAGRPRFLVAGR